MVRSFANEDSEANKQAWRASRMFFDGCVMAEWERKEKGGRFRKTGGTTREESLGVLRDESDCLESVR